ncbi:LytTR family DNA-binding domain-containing protein [uncultured Polaribacter sp.]|uniref:LytR/AlgR family response regulator transcription factor n=1 Tax=uncultured Polaribacter sp. TaxID=174711 RepID=UPI002631E920|nr:LytTR family DNA-binding domain-containing protein [uncultured Polaribacter sp.]
MKLSAIIVDDENQNIDILNSTLEDYATHSIDVIATSNNAKEAENIINELQPKVLFLDIKLDIGTAFDVLLKIKPYDYIVVFVTAYEEYILESFSYNAMSYIVKPIGIKEIVTAVNLVHRQYQLQNFTNKDQVEKIIHNLNPSKKENALKYLPIPEVNRINLVEFDKILFCKSDGRYTEIHTENEAIIVSAKNLGAYEKMLPEKLFFRMHKSFIVNLNKIIEVINDRGGSSCKMLNEEKLPVSKRKFQEFLRRLDLNT